MKKDQRQKRPHNDLAQILENGIEQIKPHSATIMRTIMFVLIVVAIFWGWQWLSAGNKADFFHDVMQLTNSSRRDLDDDYLENLVKTYLTKYPSGANHAHINLLFGNIYFNRAGMAREDGNRDQAVANYEKALGFFQTAHTFGLRQQDLAETAVWGLAQTNEALASLKEGDYFNDAIGYYNLLLEKWPSGIFSEVRQQQHTFLKRPGTMLFTEKYRLADARKFAPDFQIPGMNAPMDNIDTTMFPGDFNLELLSPLLRDNETQIEYDPGFTFIDSEETVPTPNENSETETTPESPDTTQPDDTTEDRVEIPLHRYFDVPGPQMIRY